MQARYEMNTFFKYACLVAAFAGIVVAAPADVPDRFAGLRDAEAGSSQDAFRAPVCDLRSGELERLFDYPESRCADGMATE